VDKFLSLTQFVAGLHSQARARGLLRDGPWDDLDELEAAARRLVDDAFAPELRARSGALHFAALAISMGRRPVVYQLRHGAARLVAETDLHHVPAEPPGLLRHAWIAEVHDPERETLYGDVVGLGYYPLSPLSGLVSVSYPRGVERYYWEPYWSGDEVKAMDAISTEGDGRSALLDHGGGEESENGTQAGRFAVMLGLLLEAESAPILVEDQPRNRASRRRDRSRRGVGAEWSVRHVYLDPRRRSASLDHHRREENAHDGTAGRAVSDVIVRGHIKRQHYGPKRRQVRWIYVASYGARRWVAPRPVRVVVHGAQDERQAQ